MRIVCAWVAAALALGAVGQESPSRRTVFTQDRPPATPKLTDLPLQRSVSQYGITWTFDAPARVGQFVNGDFYAVGPVTVTMIDPKPLFGSEVKELLIKGSVHEDRYPGQQARNGSALNPVVTAGMKGGFDSRIASNRYDPSLFTRLPIAMKPGDSLVSTISRRNDEIKEFDGQHVDPLRAGAVLSCVSESQPPDAFRPSYCDSARSKIYLARNLRRDLLLRLPRLKGMPETLDKYARSFERPWLDIVQWGFAAPTENLPHYGQQVVEKVGEASLLLLADYAPEEKERLLVNFVQVGIDFWGLVRAGRRWVAHGGLNSGRKWPILMAGLLLADEEMQAPKKHYPKVRFHEDDQTALCPYVYKDRTFERGWTGAKAIFTGHSPWWEGGALGDWEHGWGPVDLFPHVEWPKPWCASEGYRRANTSAAWVGQALAARLLHAEKVWDHDAFLAYVDRWMTEDDSEFMKKFPQFANKKFGEFMRHGYVWGPPWVKEMWKKHRDALPPAPDGHVDPPAERTWK